MKKKQNWFKVFINKLVYIFTNLNNSQPFNNEQLSQITDFKFFLRLFFDPLDPTETPIIDIPIFKFQITKFDFKFKNDIMYVTIELIKPGIFIGKGGYVIDSFVQYLKQRGLNVNINLKDSYIFETKFSPDTIKRPKLFLIPIVGLFIYLFNKFKYSYEFLKFANMNSAKSKRYYAQPYVDFSTKKLFYIIQTISFLLLFGTNLFSQNFVFAELKIINQSKCKITKQLNSHLEIVNDSLILMNNKQEFEIINFWEQNDSVYYDLKSTNGKFFQGLLIKKSLYQYDFEITNINNEIIVIFYLYLFNPDNNLSGFFSLAPYNLLL